MNEKLPFEDAFERRMNDMQIPSGDASWQKMNVLLDKQKKRKPFGFFQFYQLLSIALLITLVSTGIFIYYRTKSEKPVTSSNNSLALDTNAVKTPGQIQTPDVNTRLGKDDSSSVTNKKDVAVNINSDKIITSINEDNKAAAVAIEILEKTGGATNANKKHNPLPGSAITAKSLTVNNHFKNKQVNEKVLQPKVVFDFAGSKVKPRNKLPTGKEIWLHSGVVKVNKDLVRISSEEDDISPGADKTKSETQSSASVGRSLETVSIPDISRDLNAGSVMAFQATPLQQPIKLTDSIVNNIKAAELKEGLRHKKYFIASGIGFQQQVPIGGQKPVGYNSSGNKNLLEDYIPSVYVRLEKHRRWFLQGEFNYAAPQLVKPLSYRQQTSQNFAAGSYTIYSAAIKKTFYNKIPVSFNYYILPRLSIGAGAVYSWLHSAVAESKTVTKDVITQQQTITNQLVTMKGYTDSFLYRSHTYLLLKTNYSIRRFSYGISFATDLQPYIKYTLPNGTVSQQKNWSLDFSLLFKLYQSRNFSLLSKRSKKMKTR